MTKKELNDIRAYLIKASKKYETGRSMVEMLGVLAIAGVLSVGGVYGYGVAMKKHKANELLHQASMLATTISAKALTNDGVLPETITDFGNSGYATTLTDNGTKFILTMKDVDSAVCDQLKTGGMIQKVECKAGTSDGKKNAEITYYKNLATDSAEGEKSPTGGGTESYPECVNNEFLYCTSGELWGNCGTTVCEYGCSEGETECYPECVNDEYLYCTSGELWGNCGTTVCEYGCSEGASECYTSSTPECVNDEYLYCTSGELWGNCGVTVCEYGCSEGETECYTSSSSECVDGFVYCTNGELWGHCGVTECEYGCDEYGGSECYTECVDRYVFCNDGKLWGDYCGSTACDYGCDSYVSASECFTGQITPYCALGDALVGNDGHTRCSYGCSEGASECYTGCVDEYVYCSNGNLHGNCGVTGCEYGCDEYGSATECYTSPCVETGPYCSSGYLYGTCGYGYTECEYGCDEYGGSECYTECVNEYVYCIDGNLHGDCGSTACAYGCDSYMSASECFTGQITPYCEYNEVLVGNDGYTHCSNGCSDGASECNS